MTTTATRTSKMCIFNNEKGVILHALHVRWSFSLCTCVDHFRFARASIIFALHVRLSFSLCTCVYHFCFARAFIIFALHVRLSFSLCTCFYHFRFARAFVIFVHFAVVLVPSTTWNSLFCGYMDDIRIWRQIFSFIFPFLSRSYHFSSEIVRKQFENQTTWNNPAMIAEMRSYIFRFCFRCRR